MRKLTPKQQEVHDLLVLGHSNKEIARQLGKSRRAVEDLANAVYAKRGVSGYGARLRLTRVHYGLSAGSM